MLRENSASGLAVRRVGGDRVGSRRYAWAVVGLTVLAGVLRLVWLGRPGVWGDEAATFGRVCGDWKDLLWAMKETGGFAPLHYELYWVLGHWGELVPGWVRGWVGAGRGVMGLTPVGMRVVPAVAGTLMVPAVWFAARQIVSRPAALLACAFAACSAYLCVYSRDAKMYMHFWLFCTLSCGCFLAWVRVDRRIYWWLWVLCSVAMVGLHTPGFLLLGVQVLWWMAGGIASLQDAAKREWWRGAGRRLVMVGVGLVIIGVGPFIYYESFNRFAERMETGGWGASQLNWVDSYNEGRGGGELVLYTTSAFLMSWEWPSRADFVAGVDPRILGWGKGLTVGLLVAIAIGALPWGWRRRGSRIADLGAGEGWWRAVVWVAVWVGVPAYGVYCISTAGFWGPGEWAAHALRAGYWAAGWAVGLGVLVGAVWGMQAEGWRGRLIKAGTFLGVVVGLVGVAWAMWGGLRWYTGHRVEVEWVRAIWGSYPRHFHVVPRRYEFHSVWMPRYLGVVWAGFAIAVAGLIMRLPGRWVRYGVAGALLGVNLVNAVARVVVDPEPRSEMAARDVVRAKGSGGTERVYFLPEGRLDFRRAARGSRGSGRFLDMGEFILHGAASPGNGWVLGPVGGYWFSVLGAVRERPQEFRRMAFDVSKVVGGGMGTYTPAGFVGFDLVRNRGATTVVTWERSAVGLGEGDDVAGVLGKGWTRVGEERWQAWDHWSWRKTCEYRRRVYEKVGATTRGSTAKGEAGH